MKFTYGSGQRVLDGYTLKRGIGRGGFGEVYYAVSDGGKEVALKLVRGSNLDVELRGMAQCLNLKHPNLLQLYDIRTDPQGDHWIIMEYITGDPLSGILAQHPQGLTTETARQWFSGMAQGIAYLHSHGLVHRDLKPGNIFIEHGVAKVGDYGLSKFISSSQHAAQTQSIGTVHYMAPEISTGNYNKQIDVYAAGVILYEMLTGHVPFDGESAGEILMKHLTAPPDLSKLPASFAPVVGKALAKNTAQRFATMTEFARAVEILGGGSQRRESPSAPEPAASPPPVSTPVRIPAPAQVPTASFHPALSARARVAELCGSLSLTTLFAALACLVWMRVRPEMDLTSIGCGFLVTVAACWMILIPAKIWNGTQGDSGFRRVVMCLLGVLLGLGALWLDYGTAGLAPNGPAWAMGRETSSVWGELKGMPAAAGYLSYFGLVFFAVRWWKLAERQRARRFSLVPVVAAGFWAFVLLAILPRQQEIREALPILFASAIVQLVSPWQEPVPPLPRRARLRYT